MLSGDLDANGKELLRTVKLELPQLKFVEYVADRGGEIPWAWNKLRPEAKAMVADLINKQIMLEREYVTHAAQMSGSLYLRLTDQGRQVADQIRAMAIKTG